MLLSGNGRHRRPRPASKIMIVAGVTGAGVAIPLLGTTSAQAATASTWDKIAQCETGGNWSVNTGNGLFGGLQLSEYDWNAYGGKAYAARADLASRTEQIAVAEQVLASIGTEVWSECAGPAALSTHGDDDSGLVPGVLNATGLSSLDFWDTHDQTMVSDSPDPTTAPARTSHGPSATASPSDVPSTDHRHSGWSAGDRHPGRPAEDDRERMTPSPTTSATPGLTETAQPRRDQGATEPAEDGSADQSGPLSPGVAPWDLPTEQPIEQGLTTEHGTPRHAAPRQHDTERQRPSGGSGKHRAPAAEHPDATPGEYTVGIGDSLSRIASRSGVDGGWTDLYHRNKTIVGNDPDLIRPGQQLDLR